MKRFRTLAALLALVALSLSFAESVWAAVCMPGAEAAAAVSMDACEAEAHGAHTEEPADSDPRGPSSSHCPLAPLGASGSCAVAASLPATSRVDLALSPESVLLGVSPDQTRDLLLVSAFFRPPRA